MENNLLQYSSHHFIFVSFNLYSPTEDLIQALLLTSDFHKGLSFMAVGHNAMCVSTLALAAGGSRGLRGTVPGSFDCVSDPRFSNSLSMHHSVT